MIGIAGNVIGSTELEVSGSRLNMAPNQSEDPDEELPAPPVPPDGGYGWVIMVASFFNNVIVDGVCFSFGIFFPEFLDYYGDSKSKTSWVGSVINGMYLSMGPVASALANKYGCRAVGIAGSIVGMIAFTLSTLSPNVEVLILLFGVLGGIGFGLMYLPAIVMVGFYFEKRRALATGISVCGSGIGGFVFAPLCRMIIDQYAWKGAVIIVAGIVLNGVVVAALFRPLEAGAYPPKDEEEEIEKIKDGSTVSVSNGTVAKDSKDLESKDKLSPETSNGKRKKGFSESSQTSNAPKIVVESWGESGDESTEDVSEDRKEDGEEKEKKEHHHGVHKTKTIEEVLPDPVPNAPSQLQVGSQSLITSQARLRHRSNTLTKPMYRQDIFYSGSIMHLPQFIKSSSLTDYIKSTITLPSVEEEELGFPWKYMPSSVSDILRQIFDFSLLKLPTFSLYGLACFLSMAGFFIPFFYLPANAIDLGVDEHDAAFLLSVIGISNTIGRVACGWISDQPWADVLWISNVSLIVGGAATMVVPFLTSYALLAVYAAIFGLCIAAYISLRSIILVELLGLEKLTNSFGLITLFQGLSSFIGAPIAGALFNITKSYDVSFYFAGATIGISGLICVPLRCLANRQMELRGDTRNDGYELARQKPTTDL